MSLEALYASFLNVGRKTGRAEAAPTYPPLVGFSEKLGSFVQSVIQEISPDGRLFVGIPRIVYSPAPDSNMSALASYNPLTHEIVIYGPIPDEPGHYAHLVRRLTHEIGHHAYDPSPHIKRNPDGSASFNKDGSVAFTEAGLSLFGSAEKAEKVFEIMQRVMFQSILTNSYTSEYQMQQGHAFLALAGLVRLRGPVAARARDDADKLRHAAGASSASEADKRAAADAEEIAQALEAEYHKAVRDMQYAWFVLVIEGWSVIMEKALLNPENLKQKGKQQKVAWESGSFETEGQVLGFETPESLGEFVDPYEAAQGVLQLVNKTNARGIEKIRAGLQPLIQGAEDSAAPRSKRA